MTTSASWDTRASVLVLVGIWGTTWAAIRIGLEGIPPFAGVALRFGLAAVVLWLWGLVRRQRFEGGRRVWALCLVNAVGTFAVPYGVTYWSEQWLPSGLASVLFSTFPLVVAVGAHWCLPGERMRTGSLAGILLSCAGVAVLFSEDLQALGGAETRTAALVFLLAPLASGIANIVIKRWGRGVHPLSITAPPMALTAVLLGAMSLALERHREFAWSGATVGALLYLAVAGSAVTFVLYFRLLARVAATRLSLITYAIPLVALLVGTAVLGEPLTWRIALGSAMVIAGVAVALRRPRSRG